MAQLERSRWLLPGAALLGLVLGTASVYPYVYTSGPLHILGNSAAIWLLFAFGVGVLSGRGVAGAIAGAILLIATVVAFFAVYALLFPQDHSGRVEAFWLSTALVGGPVFGYAGGIWRSGTAVARGVASAMIGGAFVAEAIAFQPTGTFWRWLEGTVGIALCLVLATGRRARLVALGSLPVVTLVGLLGWAITKHAINVELA